MKVKIGPYPTHRWYHNFLYKLGIKNEPKVSVHIDEVCCPKNRFLGGIDYFVVSDPVFVKAFLFILKIFISKSFDELIRPCLNGFIEIDQLPVCIGHDGMVDSFIVV